MHPFPRLLVLSIVFPLASAAVAQELPVRAKRFVERPGELELSGRMIARPKPTLGADRRTRAVARIAPSAVRYVVATDEYILRLPAGETEETYAGRLLATGDYDYVEPDWLCFPTFCAPNDPSYSGQWHHAHIGSPQAWCHETGDASVVVAIVDGGVATDHPDLAGALVPGYNAADQLAEVDGGDVYDVDGHGTFIAGCAAATGDNGTDVVGVGWNLAIMSVRYYNNPGGGFLSDLLDGARWAVDHGANVVNVSQTGVQFATVQTTGAYIRSQGGVLVYAAGNDGADLSTFDWPDVIVVGGTDEADALLSDAFVTSAHGLALDVFAPGANILSTYVSPSGLGLGLGSGTSSSTALVSGLCGLLWSARPGSTPAEVEAYLTGGCVDLGPPGEDDYWGFGRIDAHASVLAALATSYGCGPNPPGSLTLLDGAPAVGSSFELGVDNPLGTQSFPSQGYVALATAPDPSFPCGTPVPGFGMAGPGANGELLLSVAGPNPFTVVTGSFWAFPGSPARVSISVPQDASLAGLPLFAQGVLLSLSPSAAVPLGLTEALALVIAA